MNINWAYGLIAIIYILLIVLRVINYSYEKVYKKENSHYQKAFSIKKDFFTTVMVICVLVTLAINIAALIGGQPINLPSILITLLVIGFTILNSFAYVLYTDQSFCFCGYILKNEDIESVKVKQGKSCTKLDITFTREIESYNYTRILVFGANQKAFTNLIEQAQTKLNK